VSLKLVLYIVLFLSPKRR